MGGGGHSRDAQVADQHEGELKERHKAENDVQQEVGLGVLDDDGDDGRIGGVGEEEKVEEGGAVDAVQVGQDCQVLHV